jgi:Uma2 family endonuclease
MIEFTKCEESHWIEATVSTTASLPKLRNLAELIDRLGGIPLDRVRLHPWPATVDDVVYIDAHEDRLCELVDGVLVEKTMGLQESLVASVLIRILGEFVAKQALGIIAGEAGMIRLLGKQIRMPDVAFYSWDRLPDGEIPAESAPEIVPDLAVEVLSASNSAGEMSRKLREYFRAGVPLVWYVDPASKSVTVYTSLTRSKVVPLEGTLDGGKVLPGFELPVRDLFVVKKSRSNKNGHRGKR